MRRLSLALLILPLALACASQPGKLSGTYAIVVDPSLRSRVLQESVATTLTQRLNIAASTADADAVIVLKRGRTDGDLAYEIRRGGEIIAAAEPTSTVQVRGDQRSIKEHLEAQRREEKARFGSPDPRIRESFRPPTAFNSDMARRDAARETVRHIAEMIVYDLRTKL